MNTITIPKELSKKGELVVIPREEYENLLAIRNIKEFTPTKSQRQALVRAENNLRKGKTLSYNELVKKLGFTH